MPQDKVRGRSGAYLQLLQHSLLCTVRREGHTSLKQGKSKLILPKLERGQYMDFLSIIVVGRERRLDDNVKVMN